MRDFVFQRARNASPSPPLGTLKLKWMLPSPRWPNGTGRTPGTIAATSAMPCSRKAGISFTGTETSCLIEAPSRFCASEMFSRRRHSARRCASRSSRSQRRWRYRLRWLRRRYPEKHHATRLCRRWWPPPAHTRTKASASGSRVPGICASTSSSAMPRDEFEGRDEPARRSLQPIEQLDGGLRIAHGDERGLIGCGRGIKLQRRRRDHAQRAFGADEKLFQVVARIVLVQGPQQIEHAPVRQHNFEPQHELARRTVAQHITPPALVERLPPMVQEPSEARLKGKERSARSRRPRDEPRRE